MNRLLITGTREGWDHDHLERVLREHYEVLQPRNGSPVVLVHGDAAGVDREAAAIWSAHGLPTEAHPADWGNLGKSAGPIRNSIMVNLGASQCIAFVSPRSIGTHDCIKKALAAGIPVHTYYPERPGA